MPKAFVCTHFQVSLDIKILGIASNKTVLHLNKASKKARKQNILDGSWCALQKQRED